MKTKSTVEEIRERFDHDVERFSNLETGQSATIDSPLMLEMVAEAASVVIAGCEGGAGYRLRRGQLHASSCWKSCRAWDVRSWI